MLSRPGSGSLSGPVSPDQSSCSSETGSVLIRSTRALPRRHGAGAGNVQITVQKLREPPRVQAPLTGQRLRQKPEISDAKPAAADREPGPDLLTSRFEAGGRGVVLAALKQRSHSAPHRREVRVQMLDQLPLQTSADPQDAALSSQNATGVASVQREAELNSGRHGDASSAATTAAAVVAAAAPLIKAQSDMEARVSQLADRVEKLLQPERHGEGRGRSLSQQTLQQLETLQNQQLQLQSQLLESALRIVTGHAPTTSDLTAPGRPAHLQVTHLDAAANGRSSSATAASSAAVETVPVAMETCRRDRWPEQTRDEWYLRGASRVSAAERTHLHFSSNDSQEVVRRANEMLREMGRLKTEMKVLLTQPEDSLETSRPVPDHLQVQQNQHLTRLHQSHQNQTQQNQSKQNKPPKTQSQQNRSQQKQSQQVPSQSHQNQSQQIQFQQDQSQYKKSNQSQSQLSQYHQNQSNQNKSQQNQSQQKQSQQIPSQSHQNQSQQKKSQQNQFHYEKSQQNQSQPQLSQCHQNQSNQNQSQQNQSQQIQSQQHQSESHQDQSQQNNSQHNQSHSQLSQCLQNSSHQNQSQSKQTSSQDNHFTYKPSHFQQNQSQFLQSQSQQNQSQNYQEHHFRSEPSQFHQNQSHQHTSQQNQSHPLFHQIQPKQHQTHRAQSEQFQSVLVQRKPVVPSPLEEAGQVLRQVRRQKKVLEENLEALLRAKTGEVLHCQLEALAANRDWTEEVRIKKTVDACISTLTRDIQAEMSLEDAARCRATDAAVTSQSSAHPGKRKPLSMPRTAGSRPMAGRGSRGRTAGHKAGAEPDAASGRLMDSQQVGGESYLNRLYGRAPYEGQRRTLKKSPYLRLNSPASPLGRKPRPRLVESVRGVKLKSCKTQTSLAPPLNVAPPLSLSPGRRQHRHVFSSSHLTSGDPAVLSVTPAESFPVAVAIPLGRPRIDSSRRPRTVTSSPPAPPPEAAVVAIDDGSPEQQKQQLDEDEAPPPSNTVDIIERKSEEEEEEEEKEEENVFPGSDFLSVADVIQEVSVEAEEEVLLDGGPSPPPVLYQGPAFPPQASSGLPAQDQVSVPGIEQQRDALETRLVEWVEQQLMSRIISDMYRPPQPDPAHNQHTDQSELEEGSVTSDIVEAAGGGGLQLFVDSNTSVDSDLIRQLVNEVLTETVGLMLGQRETGPGPGPAEQQQVKLAPLVLTPVPTPPPSPTQPSRETGPVTTPPPSEPTSPLNRESPQPITVPEPVATPPPSPEPGSPAAVQAPPPLTWGDAELPLDEERPEEHLDSPKQQLLMSVAEEEPPLSSPLPPPSLSTARSPSPPPEPEPASPSGGSESSSSSSISSSSTSTVTAGTEAALRHISEGEMLISLNQLAAMTEEEAVDSFSSSLQELQEMDLDPPSEGQIRGQDLLLINRMEERVTSRGERPQPGDSWGKEEEVSVGEVRDERPTKPHRTTNPSWQSQTSSPGQISQAADIGFEATNQSSVAVGNRLEPMETLTSDLSLTPPPHLEETNAAAQVVVKQLDSPTGKQEVDDRGRSRKLEVQLESFRPDESISGASDSSSDVF